jgi:MFS family permease
VNSGASVVARPMPRNVWLLIIALWIAEITGSFESSMILAAMRSLIAEFDDPAKVGWLVTAYLIVGAAVAAVVGRMGDIFGRRRLLATMLSIAALGSLISALSTSFAWLLSGRVLQGMSGAILPLCVGLVRENLPPDKVPMGVGLMISGASVGTALGLIIGGLIVDNYSWHGVFFASAAFCVTALAATLLFIPKSSSLPDLRRIDWLSGIAFAPGTIALLYYVSSAPKTGWTSPLNLLALGVGLLLLGYWLVRALRSDDPLIDVRLFGNRTIAVANIVTALVSMSTLQLVLVFSIMLQAPTWTMVGLGVSATVAGFAKLPSNILATFAGPLSGWLTGRGGGRSTMVAGGIITTIGWAMALSNHGSVTAVVAALCVIAFGATMLFAVAPTLLTQAAPPERTSEVSGMLTVVRQLFLGIGAQLVTTVLATDVVQRGGEQYPSDTAFQLAIGVIIACCVVATLVAFALPGNASLSRAQ